MLAGMTILTTLTNTALTVTITFILTTTLAAVAGLIKKLTNSKSDRRKLLDELKLVEQLPEGTSAHKHIMASIEERVIRLSYGKIFDGLLSSLQTFFAAFFLLGGITTTTLTLLSPPEHRLDVANILILFWVVGFFVVEVVLVVGSLHDLAVEKRRRKQYFETGEYPDPFTFQRPQWITRALGWLQRVRPLKIRSIRPRIAAQPTLENA
ncbi:hypothetical protein B5P44_09550 [Mycobacterium sp. CBMA 213]|uniref:hypothetical protein n=2 Tax=Mycolicibacterium TaxID=1866885 RepID=UPI0013188F47|nr:hypothetical protein [Mycolicibacterium sp. CBMA 213]QGT51758.1 hypothetical protein pCBMA213_3_00016 [Mycolicibacterium sp.]